MRHCSQPTSQASSEFPRNNGSTPPGYSRIRMALGAGSKCGEQKPDVGAIDGAVTTEVHLAARTFAPPREEQAYVGAIDDAIVVQVFGAFHYWIKNVQWVSTRAFLPLGATHVAAIDISHCLNHLTQGAANK